MSLKEKYTAILSELEPFETPQDRFQYLIDRAKSIPTLDDTFHKEEYLVEGCISQLWLVSRFENGLCYFKYDADAIIAKGIASLICDYFNGETPEDILKENADFLARVGIDQHLSPNRRNGLSNLITKIHQFAKAQLSK